ncbi:MAG TPA: hypothetical protein VFA10_02680 [Ktedonobacteraceae bacterium]|nr:hypothetical protein [Ktedonobacteraceae bacterium]
MNLQDNKTETRKRMHILAALYDYMIPSCCQAILLTGSLVYGKNVLVHQHSDKVSATHRSWRG